MPWAMGGPKKKKKLINKCLYTTDDDNSMMRGFSAMPQNSLKRDGVSYHRVKLYDSFYLD